MCYQFISLSAFYEYVNNFDITFSFFSHFFTKNIKKHHYSFKEVEKIFNDPYFYEIYDIEHSDEEQARYFGLGIIEEKCLVLQVSYTEEERIHIITARDATPKEREVYFERLRRAYC